MEKRQENLEDKIVNGWRRIIYPLLPQNPVPEDL